MVISRRIVYHETSDIHGREHGSYQQGLPKRKRRVLLGFEELNTKLRKKHPTTGKESWLKSETLKAGPQGSWSSFNYSFRTMLWTTKVIFQLQLLFQHKVMETSGPASTVVAILLTAALTWTVVLTAVLTAILTVALATCQQP